MCGHVTAAGRSHPCRLDFFTDGVFAVVMTIMILEGRPARPRGVPSRDGRDASRRSISAQTRTVPPSTTLTTPVA
ncbi:DUF1211 domain-containing protein [Gryllotalpicola protaetiae]|uniref:DUF1211 domain-containing protein n=1 Tax=Gryllotalpicola protaetiae TaxID=2419771 RepID=A0A387BK16_9MICO|nr:DUF1211 domain-containing protein [Gryllotalpicola protaetiae]